MTFPPTAAWPPADAGDVPAILVRDIAGTVGERAQKPRRRKQRTTACDFARRQEVIVLLGQRMLNSADNTVLLNDCAALIAQTLGVDSCIVWEHHATHHLFAVRACAGLDGSLAAATMDDAANRSLAGHVLHHREPLIIANHGAAETGSPTPESHCGLSSASVLIGSRHGEPFGVLQAHNRAPRAFSRDDVMFLQAIANVIATADDRAGREETLRLAEHRYRRIAANTPGMVYQFRLTADGGFSFPFASEGCREMFGVEPQNIYDNPMVVIGILHEEDRDTLLPAILASAKTMTQFHWLGRYVAPGGRVCWMRADSRPELQPDGSVIWDGMMFDISILKEAQHAMTQAKEEAERANHAKSEFLSRMSHELRTPLNAILGFGEFLQAQETREIPKDCLGHIVKAGSHLLGLINEVLDIARIEAGHIALSIQPVRVGQVVEETLDLIRGSAHERGIKLHWAPGDECNYRVLADVQRFRQVLLNLFSNAVKYNTERGVVNVVCRRVEDGRICLEVADTGPGIPADKLGRLFVAFDRLDAERGGVQGTGLGLALSKCLMEAMSGAIEVESELGLGTVFRLLLPGAPEVADAPFGSDGDAPGSANRLSIPAEPVVAFKQKHRVLYVEDDDANYLLVKRLLQSHPNIELARAANAAEGLRGLAQQVPDLLLLDLHLPDRPGEEILSSVRQTGSSRNLPVVVMSADATQQSIDRLLKAGANDYLTKPLDLRGLLATMHLLLEKMPGGCLAQDTMRP